MRRSKQGQVILEELRKLTTHPRGDELYALVRQRLPRVSLGTIYRNLDRLQREGTVMEIYCGDFVRYDGNVSPHDHFLCRGCQRVWDFGHSHVERAEEGTVGKDEAGFLVEGHYTVFYGLCADCQSRTGHQITVTAPSSSVDAKPETDSVSGNRVGLGNSARAPSPHSESRIQHCEYPQCRHTMQPSMTSSMLPQSGHWGQRPARSWTMSVRPLLPAGVFLSTMGTFSKPGSMGLFLFM
ncbi:MAG: transcriptional repressor [Chloroflexota bacterium]|nr:MAG: transcriptional repressor [Chloroflexota bacterium]